MHGLAFRYGISTRIRDFAAVNTLAAMALAMPPTPTVGVRAREGGQRAIRVLLLCVITDVRLIGALSVVVRVAPIPATSHARVRAVFVRCLVYPFHRCSVGKTIHGCTQAVVTGKNLVRCTLSSTPFPSAATPSVSTITTLVTDIVSAVADSALRSMLSSAFPAQRRVNPIPIRASLERLMHVFTSAITADTTATRTVAVNVAVAVDITIAPRTAGIFVCVCMCTQIHARISVLILASGCCGAIITARELLPPISHYIPASSPISRHVFLIVVIVVVIVLVTVMRIGTAIFDSVTRTTTTFTRPIFDISTTTFTLGTHIRLLLLTSTFCTPLCTRTITTHHTRIYGTRAGINVTSVCVGVSRAILSSTLFHRGRRVSRGLPTSIMQWRRHR